MSLFTTGSQLVAESMGMQALWQDSYVMVKWLKDIILSSLTVEEKTRCMACAFCLRRGGV